jgi:hypothetical protein
VIEFSNPRSDGKGTTGDFWREKDIRVRGYIKTATGALMETYIETIKKNLRKSSRSLDITRYSVVRRYTATWVNPETFLVGRQGFNVTLVSFEIVFRAYGGFAMDRDYSQQNVAMTSSPSSDIPTNAGIYKALPIFEVVANSASGVTAFTVTNNTTDEVIKYTGTIATGDVLEFDCENQTVKLNGVSVAFTGAFPSIDVGVNAMQFDATGGTFNFRVTTKWKNRYL